MDKIWRMATVATVATLAVVLTAGAASATTVRASGGHSADSRHHGRNHPVLPKGAFGTVASVNGTSTTGTCGAADTAGTFTVNGPHDTTFTVDVTTTPTATTFAEHGVTTPTFANVCVGDKVGALGLVSSDTVTATGVFITTSQTLKPLASFGTPKGSGSQGSKSFSPPAGQPAGNGHGFKSGSTKGWNSSGHSSQHHTH